MPDQGAAGPTPGVVISGMGVSTALGRGTGPLLAAVTAGQPAFSQVRRFDTRRCRVQVAAEQPGDPVLVAEITAVIDQACEAAGLDHADRARTPLLLALHTDAQAAREPATGNVHGQVAGLVTTRSGFACPRVYTTACVAASTAIADAATMIRSRRATAVVVAAGYLVEADSFGLFDAGRALASDGQVRPFSAGRRGMLLGDGAAAMVLEADRDAQARDVPALARLVGWGRAGDAYHVCQPRPEGTGLARAISAALERAKVSPHDIGYVNANGSGTAFADASEAAAIHQAFGADAGAIPVSSTKSVHGHALEASALVELVVTVLALRAGLLPVNAGFLGADAACELNLVLGTTRETRARYALSLNAAFGGANTALLVGAA